MTRLVPCAVTTLCLLASVLADEPSNARRPKDDTELRSWLENMIWNQNVFTRPEEWSWRFEGDFEGSLPSWMSGQDH